MTVIEPAEQAPSADRPQQQTLPDDQMYARENLPNFVFFRRSEVMLFFEGADAQDPLHSESSQLLKSLREQGVAVHEHSPFAGPNGRREPLLVRRNGEVRGVLHAVNLSAWVSEQERQQKEGKFASPQDVQDMAKGYSEVANEVKKLNDLAAAGLVTWGNLKLAAAGPNWLVGPLTGYDGGPAGRPIRPRAPRFDASSPPRFRSDAPGHRHLPFAGTGRRIMVAVFDTWPAQLDPAFHPFARIDACASRIAGNRRENRDAPPENTRLAQAANGQIVPAEHIEDFVHPDHNASWALAPYGCAQVQEKPYYMADHGLFVVDIINDLAPMAEIHVYRVLNHMGLGDLDTLARAVQHAIDEAKASNMPLILNLSLGISPSALMVNNVIGHPDAYYLTPAQVAIDIKELTMPTEPPPPGQEFDANSAVQQLRKGGLIDENANRFIGPLSVVQKLFDRVEADNVLAIAAAGNDSCGWDGHFNPRLPAAIDGVLAVSAFQGTTPDALKLANYSNTDDFFADSDGVGAFGGDVQDSFTVDGNALVGLYSGEDLPPGSGGQSNTSGWAEWSGTSFATPVVTGVAACLWSEDVTQSATDVRVALQKMSTAQPNDYLPFMQQ